MHKCDGCKKLYCNYPSQQVGGRHPAGETQDESHPLHQRLPTEEAEGATREPAAKGY
jgi:hypothetical protein